MNSQGTERGPGDLVGKRKDKRSHPWWGKISECSLLKYLVSSGPFLEKSDNCKTLALVDLLNVQYCSTKRAHTLRLIARE